MPRPPPPPGGDNMRLSASWSQKPQNAVNVTQHWTPDAEVRECQECRTPFSTLRRRHHCRFCGDVFCSSCTPTHQQIVMSTTVGVSRHRACQVCFETWKQNVHDVSLEIGSSLTLLTNPEDTSQWVPDSEASVCARCEKSFTLSRRRHHCRRCKKVVCGACSPHTLDNARACTDCYESSGQDPNDASKGWMVGWTKARPRFSCSFFVRAEKEWSKQQHDVKLFVARVDFNVTAKGKTIASESLMRPPYQISVETEEDPTASITLHLKDKVERISHKIALKPPAPGERQPVETVAQVIATKVCLHASYQVEDTTAKPVTAPTLLSLTSSPKRSNSNEHQGWVAEKTCSGCSKPFTQLLRRHHCRRCKESVCSACSPHKLQSTDIVHYKKYVRVCDSCYEKESSRAETGDQESKDEWLINNSAGGDFDGVTQQEPEPESEPDLKGAREARANPVWVARSESCMLCLAKEEDAPGAVDGHCRYCGWTMCSRCGPPELVLDVDRWVSSAQGHPIKYGDRETTVEWKWADAFTAGVSRLNPLRWSTGPPEVILEDLDRRAQAGGSDASRPVQVRLKCGGAVGGTLRGLLNHTLGGDLGGSMVAVGDSAVQIVHNVKGYLNVERKGLLGTEEDSNAMEQSFHNPATAAAWLQRLLSSEDTALLTALCSKSKRVCENCALHAPQEMHQRMQDKRRTRSSARTSISSVSSFASDVESEVSPRDGAVGGSDDERTLGRDWAVRTRSGGLRTAVSADLSEPTRPSPASQFSTAVHFIVLRRTYITMGAEPNSENIGEVGEGDVVEALRTLNDDDVGLRVHIGRGYVTVNGSDGEVNLRRAVGDEHVSPVRATKTRTAPPFPVMQPESDSSSAAPIVLSFIEDGSLGVNLVETKLVDNTVAVIVESVRSDSQATRHVPTLRNGLIVVAVGGTDVRGQSFDRVVDLVQEYPGRPIEIEFVAPQVDVRQPTSFTSRAFGQNRHPTGDDDDALRLAAEAKSARIKKFVAASDNASQAAPPIAAASNVGKKTAAQQMAEADAKMAERKMAAEKAAAAKAAAKEEEARAKAIMEASAKRIQARIRGQGVRREYWRQMRAVATLQRATRSHFAAIAMTKLKEEQARLAAEMLAKAEAAAERKRAAKIEARERAAAAKLRKAREVSAGTLRVDVLEVSLKTEGAYTTDGWTGYSAPFIQVTVAGVTFQSWLPTASQAPKSSEPRRKEVGSQGCFCFAVPGSCKVAMLELMDKGGQVLGILRQASLGLLQGGEGKTIAKKQVSLQAIRQLEPEQAVATSEHSTTQGGVQWATTTECLTLHHPDSGQVLGSVKLQLQWASWLDKPPAQDLVTATFEAEGSLGLDLIFPFVKSVTPGSLASAMPELRPGMVITHVGDTSMEYKRVEDAFAEVKKIGRPLQMCFRAVPSPWSTATMERHTTAAAATTLEQQSDTTTTMATANSSTISNSKGGFTELADSGKRVAALLPSAFGSLRWSGSNEPQSPASTPEVQRAPDSEKPQLATGVEVASKLDSESTDTPLEPEPEPEPPAPQPAADPPAPERAPEPELAPEPLEPAAPAAPQQAQAQSRQEPTDSGLTPAQIVALMRARKKANAATASATVSPQAIPSHQLVDAGADEWDEI